VLWPVLVVVLSVGASQAATAWLGAPAVDPRAEAVDAGGWGRGLLTAWSSGGMAEELLFRGLLLLFVARVATCRRRPVLCGGGTARHQRVIPTPVAAGCMPAAFDKVCPVPWLLGGLLSISVLIVGFFVVLRLLRAVPERARPTLASWGRRVLYSAAAVFAVAAVVGVVLLIVWALPSLLTRHPRFGLPPSGTKRSPTLGPA
jgi:hypothetical protein